MTTSLVRKILLFLAKKYTSIGGQAIIEGVMMRSPHSFIIAIRQEDGKIRLRKDQWFSWAQKYPFLKKPFLRGIVALIESMANGISALNYSANIAMKEELKKEAIKKGKSEEEFLNEKKKTEKVGLATFFTMLVSFAFGMGLFVFLPHWITIWLGHENTESFTFHFIDGLIKAFIFIFYIFAISLLPDIKRIFQYHGAEHKAISTFEAGDPLLIEKARKYTTLHPRCGTSFIFFLIFLSIVFFAGIFPILKIGQDLPFVIKHIAIIISKIALMFPIASISYEILKLAGQYSNNIMCKTISFPGMMLQKLTTKEPDDKQLEVGLVALKAALIMEEKFNLRHAKDRVIQLEEIEITSLSDLEESNSQLKDFLE